MENNILKLLALVVLFCLTGCNSTRNVAITPLGGIDNEFKNIANGKVHIYPVTQSPTIVKNKDGRTSLSQGWTPNSKAEPDYVTDADLSTIISERSKQALEEAGYTVTLGPEAPRDAVLTLQENILGVFENPTTPLLMNMLTAYAFGFVGSSSHPVGEIYVNVTHKDANGMEKSVVVKGRGKSSAHLTKQSGFDRSMKFAFKDFQENLVKATRNALP